jgi:hypothetical protein
MANLSNINNILRTNSTGVGIFADAGSYPLEISSAGTAGVKLINTAGATYDVYANASEEFIIAKNGVGNRLTISSGGNATFSGNVGINTAATNATLIVTGNVTDDWAGRFENTNAGGYGILAKINSTSSGDYIFQARTGTTNVMTILGSGNVGIGTVTPGTKLEIFGNNSARNTLSKILTINGGTSAGNPYSGFGMGIYFNGRDYSNEVRDYGYIYSVMETSGLSTPGGDTGFSSQLQFYTNTGGATNTLPTQKMVIKADGTVNITDGNLEISKFSTTTPYANGEIRFLGRYGRYVGGIQTFSDNPSYPEYANGLDFFVQRHVYTLPNGHLAMRIDSDGNVGIGTLTPTQKLNVVNDNTGTWTAKFENNTNKVYLSVNDANNYGIYISGETKNYFSGNVGIGTTSPGAKLHIKGNNNGNTSEAILLQDGNAAGGIRWNDQDDVEQYGLGIQANSGNGYFGIYANRGNAPFNRATEIPKLVVKNNGNVGIGTTSPATKLHVVDSTALQAQFSGYSYRSPANNARAASGSLRVGNGSGSTGLLIDYTDQGQTLALIQNEYTVSTISELRLQSPFISFYTGTTASERMRITSVGRITINTTVVADAMCTIAGNSSNYALNLYADSIYSGIYRYQRFRSGTNIAGGIEGNNQTSVQYVTTSDYRTKKNIKPLENGLDRVCKLKPVKFDWKLNDETTEGFIAHEVQDIFPEAVSGEKDGEEMQGMDYGRITPLLVKAIQELKAEIELLKNKPCNCNCK